jgi:antitoxin ParD1/3/4
MANVEKISVAVTPEMATMMKDAVGSGDYASSSELMREALREWRERRELRAQLSDKLGKLWDIGIASGDPIDGKEALSALRAKLAKSKAAA